MSLASAGERTVMDAGASPPLKTASATMEIHIPDLIKLVSRWPRPSVLVDSYGKVVSWSRGAADMYRLTRNREETLLWSDVIQSARIRSIHFRKPDSEVGNIGYPIPVVY